MRFADDLTKVFEECNTMIVITVPELIHKVKEAIAGLGNIKVTPLSDVGPKEKSKQTTCQSQCLMFRSFQFFENGS